MAPNIEPIGSPLGLGEGPYWDEETQMLYYVDILNHSLHSYNQKTNEHHSVNVVTDGNAVSLIVKIKGEKNKFIISVKNNLAIVSWDGVSSKPLVPELYVTLEGAQETTRLNDGKCDPSNRLWAGTMGAQIEGTIDQFEQEKGSLYCLHKDKKVVKHFSKVGISNGLAWSMDNKKLYYIDSLKYRVDSYDYDDTTGTLANEKQIFCFKKNNIEGLPDGMTIDAEGMLWVACFGGAQVLRIDPNCGELKMTLKMPSPQITSVGFGGVDLENLYVTSAKVGFTAELEAQFPLAGHTYCITGLNVRGTPSVPFHL